MGDGGVVLIALLLRDHSTVRGEIYGLFQDVDHIVPFSHTAGSQFTNLGEYA